jgi:hypothetical protein
MYSKKRKEKEDLDEVICVCWGGHSVEMFHFKSSREFYIILKCDNEKKRRKRFQRLLFFNY